MSDDQTNSPAVTLGVTRGDKAVFAALLGMAGLVLFLVLPWIADWLREVPFVPLKEQLAWVGELDEPWAWVVRPATGLVLGLIAAAVLLADERMLELSHDQIVVVRGADRRTLPREKITGAYREGKRIVIHGEGGRTLFDHDIDAKPAAVSEAFNRFDYPWESN